mmetsp:Transcript_86397/g.230802  ORF Transcript_86397/g.230802 Transcript_86397/m.230802 type:complete len:95 (-) Transcript_86397:1018-1302(-)
MVLTKSQQLGVMLNSICLTAMLRLLDTSAEFDGLAFAPGITMEGQFLASLAPSSSRLYHIHLMKYAVSKDRVQQIGMCLSTTYGWRVIQPRAFS